MLVGTNFAQILHVPDMLRELKCWGMLLSCPASFKLSYDIWKFIILFLMWFSFAFLSWWLGGFWFCLFFNKSERSDLDIYIFFCLASLHRARYLLFTVSCRSLEVSETQEPSNHKVSRNDQAFKMVHCPLHLQIFVSEYLYPIDLCLLWL